MKTHRPKVKTPPRPLFSCGIFRNCTQTVLSPTTTQTPTLPPPASDPLPPPPPPPRSASDPRPSRPQPESESSSSSTSQSFTQWRFFSPKSPILHQHPPESDPPQESASDALPQTSPEPDPPPPVLSSNLGELLHVAELQLSTGSDAARLSALHLLERSLVPNPLTGGGGNLACLPAVMTAVVGFLKDPAGAKPATKVLLALCLAEDNRQVAIEVGAVIAVVETVAELEVAAAERALAVLELLCKVPEGAAELRAHALAVPMLVEMMGKMAGRGKECALSVLAAIFGGSGDEAAAPPDEVARAVVLTLQGECSARGRRKGAQILKTLQENGRLDLTEQLQQQ